MRGQEDWGRRRKGSKKTKDMFPDGGGVNDQKLFVFGRKRGTNNPFRNLVFKNVHSFIVVFFNRGGSFQIGLILQIKQPVPVFPGPGGRRKDSELSSLF
jgi:hypothetical protein